VLVTGADAAKAGAGEPFVASFDANGRERFRVKLDQPRSTLAPPRAVAVAAAATSAGDAYVVSLAARSAGPTAVALSLLDTGGRVRFSVPLELSGQVEPALVVEPDGAVLVGGSLPSGREFAIVKLTHDGTRAWTKTYPVVGSTPRLLRFGSGLALVGALSGTAEFGDVKLARTETLQFRCSGDEHACDERAQALFVAELGPEGETVRARVLGGPASRISLTGVAASGDRLFVTGEYAGPPVAVGRTALCELEPGMPEREETGGFRELGDGPHCSCRGDQRDLFLLSLGTAAEPRWARTLALGGQTPRLALGGDGALRWAAEVWRSDNDGDARSRGKALLELWSLDAEGAVSRRRAAAAHFRHMAAGGSAVYLSDERTLRKATW